MLKNFRRTALSAVCAPETALKKLKKEGIPVFSCKKEGARFIFSVKDCDVKKVFAIFAKPCYNIVVYGESGGKRLLSRAFARAGLIFGCALFVLGAYLSQSLVLKIEVTGSGSYLSPEIRRIVREEGAFEWRPLTSFDAPVATGRILALPRVTFCNIKKRGSVLCVDVRCDAESAQSVDYSPLAADVGGVVRSVVAICGTACVAVGDTVAVGDKLIDCVAPSGDGYITTIAAGYAEIEWTGESSYFAEAESERALREAYASVSFGDEIISLSHTVERTEGGVNYLLKYACLHRVSKNL